MPLSDIISSVKWHHTSMPFWLTSTPTGCYYWHLTLS